MADRFDESLLTSPLPDERRSRKGVGVVVVLVAIAAVVALLALRSRSDQEPVQAAPVEETTTITVTTTTLGRVDLVPFTTDPLILTLPTSLPKGMRVCAEEPVMLCDPDEPSRTITITHQAEMLRDTSSAGADGIRRLPSDDLAMAIAFPGSALIYTAEGIPPHQLVSIVSSVPLASSASIIVPDEVPLAEPLSQKEVAELAGVPEESVEDRGTGAIHHWSADADGVFFDGFEIDESWMLLQHINELREWAGYQPTPVSVSSDRTLVVGYRDFTRHGETVWEHSAMWIQRGSFWILNMEEILDTEDSRIDADEFVKRVLAIERDIAEHP